MNPKLWPKFRRHSGFWTSYFGTCVFLWCARSTDYSLLDSWSLAALAMLSKHNKFTLPRRIMRQHNSKCPPQSLLCKELSLQPTTVSQGCKENLRSASSDPLLRPKRWSVLHFLYSYRSTDIYIVSALPTISVSGAVIIMNPKLT